MFFVYLPYTEKSVPDYLQIISLKFSWLNLWPLWSCGPEDGWACQLRGLAPQVVTRAWGCSRGGVYCGKSGWE